MLHKIQFLVSNLNLLHCLLRFPYLLWTWRIFNLSLEMKCCVLLTAMFSFHTFFLWVRQPKLIQLLTPKHLISSADLFTFFFFFPSISFISFLKCSTQITPGEIWAEIGKEEGPHTLIIRNCSLQKIICLSIQILFFSCLILLLFWKPAYKCWCMTENWKFGGDRSLWGEKVTCVSFIYMAGWVLLTFLLAFKPMFSQIHLCFQGFKQFEISLCDC